MTILKPSDVPSPMPGSNSEGWGYLQLNVGTEKTPIPHTGIDLNINHGRSDDDLGARVQTALDGKVVAAIPRLLYSWGRLVVIRSVLPFDVVSAGLSVRAGTVVYQRFGHLASFSAYRGQTVIAGQQIGTCGGSNGTMNGPYRNRQDTTDINGQWDPHLHYDIRIGGPKGLPSWDAGDERAVQEWPSARGYGYPAVGTSGMLKACALRWLDPKVLIPAAIMRNATPAPRVL